MLELTSSSILYPLHPARSTWTFWLTLKRSEKHPNCSGERTTLIQRRNYEGTSRQVPGHGRTSATSPMLEATAALFRTSSNPFVQAPSSQGVSAPVRSHNRGRTSGFWDTILETGVPSGISTSSRRQTSRLRQRTERNSTSSPSSAKKPSRKADRQAEHGNLPRARRGHSLDGLPSVPGKGQSLELGSHNVQKSKGHQFEVYKRFKCGQCDQRFFQNRHLDNYVKVKSFLLVLSGPWSFVLMLTFNFSAIWVLSVCAWSKGGQYLPPLRRNASSQGRSTQTFQRCPWRLLRIL